MDGYTTLNMDQLLEQKAELDIEMSDLLVQMKSIPNVDLQYWVDSLSKVDGYDTFKLADYSRMFTISRKYKILMEQKDNTERRIKIASIEKLIEQIKEIAK